MPLSICVLIFPKHRIIFFAHYVLLLPLLGNRNHEHFDTESYRMFLYDIRQLCWIRPSPLPLCQHTEFNMCGLDKMKMCGESIGASWMV